MPTRNANETIYLQRVELPEICFLQEFLYYVAFGRLPLWLDTGDIRMEPIWDIDGSLTDDECKNCALPLPPDPRLKYDWSFGVTLCDDLPAIEAFAEKHVNEAAEQDGSQGESTDTERVRIEAAKLHKEISEWRPKHERTIELAAAKVYSALREGRLTSEGKRLPDPDLAASLKMLEGQGKQLVELEFVAIPQNFWSLQHINWETSAARNEGEHYCHIHCLTEEVMSLFPHDSVPAGVATGEPVDVTRHGSFFVLSGDGAALPAVAARRSQSRGGKRGPGAPEKYPWKELHVEVAAIIAREGGKLPPKRDSVVHELHCFCEKLGWQEVPKDRTLRDFLKRYYERFGRNSDS